MVSPLAKSSAPLRLWVPPETDDGTNQIQSGSSISPEWSITDLFQNKVLPDLENQGRSDDTLSEYRRAVGRWEAFLAEYRIPHPVFPSITGGHLADFSEWCERHRIQGRALEKTIGCLCAIIRWAVDRDFPCRVPKPPRRDRMVRAARKLILSDEQLGAMYEVAPKVCHWPERNKSREPLPYPAADGWRCALVLWVIYGMRTEELINYSANSKSLTWEQIYSDSLTPHEDGTAVNAHGWLVYTPQKQARFKPDPLVLPLHAIARAHLERLRGGRQRGRVFDWPLSRKLFYRTWHAWCAAAGVIPRRSLQSKEGDQFLPKHLRKTCVTKYERHRPGIAGWIVGHAGERSPGRSVVTDRHYFAPEESILEAIQTVPLPAAFFNS